MPPINHVQYLNKPLQHSRDSLILLYFSPLNLWHVVIVPIPYHKNHVMSSIFKTLWPQKTKQSKTKKLTLWPRHLPPATASLSFRDKDVWIQFSPPSYSEVSHGAHLLPHFSVRIVLTWPSVTSSLLSPVLSTWALFDLVHQLHLRFCPLRWSSVIWLPGHLASGLYFLVCLLFSYHL